MQEKHAGHSSIDVERDHAAPSGCSLLRIDRDGRPLQLPLDGHEAIAAGEAVHRQLRPDLPGDYVSYLCSMIGEGALLTQLWDEREVRAIAVSRAFTTTYCGLRFEIDDLVAADDHRSKSYGGTLLSFLEGHARRMGCNVLTLNSAVHRADAHRFYFARRYGILGFHFSKGLDRD